MEIQKCQKELAVVNEHNQQELNKLRTSVAKDLRRQEVKAALDKVDNQAIINNHERLFFLTSVFLDHTNVLQRHTETRFQS